MDQIKKQIEIELARALVEIDDLPKMIAAAKNNAITQELLANTLREIGYKSLATPEGLQALLDS